MNQHGFILPISLILIALMLTLSTYSSGIIPELINRAEISLHGIVAAKHLNNNLIQLPISSSGNKIKCVTSSANRGSISVTGNICYQFPSLLPLLNIDELNQMKCAAFKAHSNQTTLAGTPLSSGSIISKHACSILPIGFADTDILIGNFDTTTPFTITHDLSVSGYFNVSGDLSTSGDLGVLAGGDILIDSITSSDAFPHIIYLHSRSGIISVGTVAPEITVYCQAHSHNCPQTQPGPYWAPVSLVSQIPIEVH